MTDPTLRWTLRLMLVWWCIGWPLIALERHAEAQDTRESRDRHRTAYQECMTGVVALDRQVARAESQQAEAVRVLERGLGLEVER